MVDFNNYRCRNCDHFHFVGSVELSSVGKCGRVLNIDKMDFCTCDSFESSNNLIYLEELSKKNER